MKVAVVQFAPVWKDVKANLRKMALLCKEAADSSAKLVLFPELATCGYSFMSTKEALPFANTTEESDPVMSVMTALAKKYGITIVFGCMLKDQDRSASGNLYNSQVLIKENGQFCTFNKINLWGNDFLWATGGRSNPPIVDVEGFSTGLLICRDVRDKKDDTWTSFYEPGEASIVCLSANWGDGGFPAIAWMDFAKNNKTTLLVSNRYGQEENNNFGEGGSCIIHSNGKVVCDGLLWSRDCIIYGDVI